MMFRNFFKSAPSGSLASWLIGLAGLVLVATAVTFFFLSPSGSVRKDPRSAGQPDGSATSPVNRAAASRAGLNFDDWKRRIAKATPQDFAALLREIMGIEDAALRLKVATQLVAKWVSVDLDGFVAFVDETEVDDDDAQADSLWALLAPALANALPMLSDEAASRPGLYEIVRRLVEYSARKDPVQALAWAKQWLMDDLRESALATIAGEMIKKSPEQALEVFREIRSPVRRVDAINAIAPVYGAAHPEEATQWAKTLPVEAERPYAMNAVLVARAEVEPAAAATELVDFRRQMETTYAAERTAEIARMGLTDIQPRSDGSPLTPEEATDSELLPVKDHPQLGLLEDAALAVAENWAAAEPAKAMQWSEALPAGRLRDEAVESALTGWASRQPEDAYAYYQKNYAAVVEPAQPLFEAWAQADPAGAAGHATQLADPAVREKAVAGVVSGWLDKATDEAGLAAWVDKLPGKRERDAANAQIAEAQSFDEPDTAWQRATAVQDPATRRQALKATFASLVESDPGRARTLLAETKNLTADETARLNKMLQAVTPVSSN